VTLELAKGGNASIPAGPLHIVVTSAAGHRDFEVIALVLGADDKVRADSDMVFFNQPTHPAGAVAVDGTTVELDLALVEPAVNKIVIAVWAGDRLLCDIDGLRIEVGTEAAFEPDPSLTEKVLVLGEVYRRGAGWRFRAVGQGWDGGLATLLATYGVAVEDQPDGSRPAVEPVAPQVRTTVGEDRLPDDVRDRLNLRKKQVLVSLVKRGAGSLTARVLLVLDASGSMAKLYLSGAVTRAVERIAAVAAQLDDDGVMQAWSFANEARSLPSLRIGELPQWLAANTTRQSQRDHSKTIGHGNHEPVVIRDVLTFTNGHPTADPTLVVFFSDGGVYKNKEIEELLRGAAKLPVFWQFVGLGDKDYGVLQRFDTLTGRDVDNTGFFAVDDLDKVSDADLYDRLLDQFPQWVAEATRLGIIGAPSPGQLPG
jgi:stress response protein SCP2